MSKKDNHRLGTHHTEETKIKMSLASKGKSKSKEHCLALSKARIGKVLTTEHRQNISKSNKGKKKSFRTDEHKRKISISKMGQIGNWKGGITPISHKLRNSLVSRLWRKSCLERDNFICQKTGVKGGDLVVHHINNFMDFPELRTSIDNGITLSKKSHQEFHNKYGFRNNTRSQLEEFLSINN